MQNLNLCHANKYLGKDGAYDGISDMRHMSKRRIRAMISMKDLFFSISPDNGWVASGVSIKEAGSKDCEVSYTLTILECYSRLESSFWLQIITWKDIVPIVFFGLISKK